MTKVYIGVYTLMWGLDMQSTKVFKSGNSQAIRLPKECQVTEKELFVQKIGGAIILLSKEDPLELFRKSLSEFTPDCFAEGRWQPKTQKREW
ncbi:antitoxin [Endomicrobiia bacterium]|nr:antitoxin [Endomicrobiia bacterium]